MSAANEELVPDVEVQLAPKKKGVSFGGCVAVGCLGMMLCMFAAVIAGYYCLMRTSLPLQFVESAIESSGEVEIDGIGGSLSSGFSADEIRFKTDVKDKWSSVKDVNFSYDSHSSLFSGEQYIIEDVSVGSGKIYTKWDPEDQQLDISSILPNSSAGGVDPELMRVELEIKNLSVRDLEIVNTTADTNIKIDLAKLSDFHVKDGELKSLGTIEVDSNQIEVSTTSAESLTDLDHTIRLQGQLKPTLDARLAKGSEFSVEFGIDKDFGNGSLNGTFFDGGLGIQNSPTGTVIEYKDLNLHAYLNPPVSISVPTNINLRVELTRDNRSIVDVSSDGTVTLGETTFSNIQVAEPAAARSLMGEAVVDGKAVTINFVLTPASPMWRSVVLDSKQFESTREVWAQTCFGKTFDELSPQQQQDISAATETTKPAELNEPNEPATTDEPETDEAESFALPIDQ